MWYTIEFQADPDWQLYVIDAFDLSSDPVRITQLAAGALLFLRGDVRAAQRQVERSSTLLIEPVSRLLMLRNVEAATAVHVQALDGAGRPLGALRSATRTSDGWEILIGDPVTTWYEITMSR